MRINRHKRLWNAIFNPLVDPSAGAMIMAMGIFLLGAIRQFPFLNDHLGLVCTYLIMSVWLFLLFSFFLSFFKKGYLNKLVQSPIKSFAVGTWVASSSVMGKLILYRMPSFLPFVKVLLYVNLILWGIFIILCVYQLKRVIANGYIKDSHGIILLSTVSTQSIVCLLLGVYKTNIAHDLIISLIILGIVFYLFCFILLIIRFAAKQYDIHEWKNTDCIIHGAVSITGLSMTLSGYFSFSVLLFIWYIALCLFVMIEMVELIRGFNRVKEYGWRRGLFIYHLSQWARNFTFGMFYFFTMQFVNHYSTPGQPLSFQKYFLHALGWGVLALMIIEIFLLFSSKLNENQKNDIVPNRRDKGTGTLSQPFN